MECGCRLPRVARLLLVAGCSSASAFSIRPAKGSDTVIQSAASFFVDGFWRQGTTVGSLELTGPERSELVSQQTSDMQARYGELVGQRRLKSQLILATDESEAIVGCVGVEMALIQPQSGKVLTRSQGEGLLNGELSVMGGRERNQYRKMSAVELTAALFPEYQCYGLLANLAVAPQARGSGLGKALCDACAEVAVEWGVQAIMLQVEEANTPAKSLYESVGYQLVHRDEAASALRVKAGAGASKDLLRREASTLLLLGKGLVA